MNGSQGLLVFRSNNPGLYSKWSIVGVGGEFWRVARSCLKEQVRAESTYGRGGLNYAEVHVHYSGATPQQYHQEVDTSPTSTVL